MGARVVSRIAAAGIALAIFGCVPAHQYEPLQLEVLSTGNTKTLNIHSSADWRNTGIQVHQGEVYRTATRGTWSPGGFCGVVTASGLDAEHLMCMKGIFVQSFQMPSAKIGALLGKIGLNGKPFVIGGTQGFIADRDGTLFMVMNDPTNLMFDNSGQIEVVVQRYQEGGAKLSFSTPAGRAIPGRKIGKHTASKTAKQYGSGYYSSEKDIAFNVLESVGYDARTGELSLAGRFDPKYLGPRIPYLQHLATFVENPGPQVSLDWTPEFERRVDTFFRRMDSEREMANLIGAGQLLDSAGNLTKKGKLFLPLFGVKPHKQGTAAGSLGVTTRFKETGIVVVTRVAPNSAAERAGLKVGNEITMITGPDNAPQQPHAPQTLLRSVRFAGAGAQMKINVDGHGPESEVLVTLDAYPGDPWEHVTKYDTKAAIFRIGGRSDIANVLQSLDKMQRLQDTKAGLDSLWFLLYHLNVGNWAQQNRQQVMKGQITKQEFNNRLARKIVEGMETSMSLAKGTMTNVFDRARRRGVEAWAALDVAVLELNKQLEPVFKASLRTALHKNDQVTMPVSILDPNTDFSPEVTPRYIGIPSNSELARLFVEADYVGKAIIHKPDLSKRIPAYKTEYAFTGDRPGRVEETTSRLWIEPSRVEVHRSSSNSTLRFGATEMRINIGRAIGGGVERRDDAYGRFLTGLYDDLAGEFHQLHELREAAKLAVAARWIKVQSSDFTMPPQGRTQLRPPTKLEGFVTLIWSPKRIKVSLIAPGGIDFNVPPIGPSGPVFPDKTRVNVPVSASVVDLRDMTIEDMPRVDPILFSSKAPTPLPARYRRPLAQPPVPASVRLVTRATKGQRSLGRIAALKTQTRAKPGRCNIESSRSLRDKLNHAARVAKKLQGVESALNAITSQQPDRQRALKAVSKTLIEEQKRLRDGAMDLAFSGLLGVYDDLKGGSQMRSIQDLETLVATMRQAKSKLGDITSKLSQLDLAISSAMARSLNERERAQKELLVYIKDTLGQGSTITGNDATSRALRSAGKTINLAGKIQTALDGAESLYKLADAVETLERLDTQSQQESKGLKKSLLPLQRKLSDQLDAAMNDPLVKSLESGTGQFDCGS